MGVKGTNQQAKVWSTGGGGLPPSQDQKIDGQTGQPGPVKAKESRGPAPEPGGQPRFEQQDGLSQGHRTSTEELTPTNSGKIGGGTSLLGHRLGGGPLAPAFKSPQFEMHLDEATGSQRRPDNSLKMLFDGVHSFAQRHELIKDAKESIHLQTFIFTDDETGWDLAKALAAKAEEGLEVRVIYDALGSSNTGPEIFDFMREHGAEVRPYGKMSEVLNLNARWHEKSMIVDGEQAVLGGMNIADEYAFGGSGKRILKPHRKGSEAWRDVDVLVKGPAVNDAQAGFLRNWAELGPAVTDEQAARLLPEPKHQPGGPHVRYVQHHPHGEPPDQNTKELYLACIRSAKKSITIENAYFVPSKEIRDALCDAAARGVKVRIMSNSEESNDITAVTDCARYFYRELLEAGCELYEKLGGTVHSKTASFDEEYSIIGSCNLNGRSEGRDAECVIGTDDGAVARELEARFAEGVSKTQPVTLDDLDNQGAWKTIRQYALSSLAWTF